MNKKIICSAIVALMISGTTFFEAFAAMPNGTVVIGNKAFSLAYANDPDNIVEITDAIVVGGEVYVKGFNTFWIDNTTSKPVAANVIPALVYRSSGKEISYDTMDKEQGSTTAIESVNTIDTTKNIGETYTLPVTVMATLSDGTTKELGITWDKAADTKVAGKFTFIGILTVVYGVVNPNNVTITAKLTVLDIDPTVKVTSIEDIRKMWEISKPTNTNEIYTEGAKLYSTIFSRKTW